MSITDFRVSWSVSTIRISVVEREIRSKQYKKSDRWANICIKAQITTNGGEETEIYLRIVRKGKKEKEKKKKNAE